MTREAVAERVWSSLRQEAGLPTEAETDAEALASTVRALAYHEAGHAAARAALLGRAAGLLSVSILPVADSGFAAAVMYTVRGRRRRRRLCRADMLAVIMIDAAGDVALSLAFPLQPGLSEALAEDPDWSQGCPARSDADECQFHASLLAEGAWTVERVRRLAAAWTRELLEVPAVWRAVEQCAAELVEHGEISGAEPLGRIFGGLREALHDPALRRRWFRRLPGVFDGP
jgi:hypothetical protein